jgi:hypothetical protein
MPDTTTISIRTDQRAALEERKQHDREPLKAVVDRLLEEGAAEPGDTLEVVPADEIELEIPEAAGDADAGASYDDIKAACAAAIREELGEVLQR